MNYNFIITTITIIIKPHYYSQEHLAHAGMSLWQFVHII